jgi:hypothetical protein
MRSEVAAAVAAHLRTRGAGAAGRTGAGAGRGGLWWNEHQQSAAAAERASRQSRTTASVTAALEDAKTRAEEAWSLADEPDKMRTATDLALAAVRRAEGFANTGEPTPDILSELVTVRGAADDLDRHTRLFVAADLALRSHGLGSEDYRAAAVTTTSRFEDAFRQFGWDPLQTPAADIAAEIAASRVRTKLLGFLCDWERQSGWDKAVQDHIREIIRSARLQSGGYSRGGNR